MASRPDGRPLNGVAVVIAMHAGAVSIEAAADAMAVAEHLAECLREADASWVAVDGRRVRFTGGVFRSVRGWNASLNVLLPFGHGELHVAPDARRVAYRVSFAEMMIVGGVLIGIISPFVAAASSSRWEALAIAPLMWTFLVGGNAVLGLVHFRDFIRRSAASTPPAGDNQPLQRTGDASGYSE